ncbi:MAG: hypothetical protein KC621_17130 [Myxococcales bacterium]|nr:hypothetical protein [Myxococcales bacterium]
MVMAPNVRITLADLCAALQDAGIESTEDEELAEVIAQTVVLEHLIDGTWAFDSEDALL